MLRRTIQLGLGYFGEADKAHFMSLPSADFPVLRDILSCKGGRTLTVYVVFRDMSHLATLLGHAYSMSVKSSSVTTRLAAMPPVRSALMAKIGT